MQLKVCLTAAAADLTAEGNKRMKEDRSGPDMGPESDCMPSEAVGVHLFYCGAAEGAV